MSSKGNIVNNICEQQLNYWCFKPTSTVEYLWENTTGSVPGTIDNFKQKKTLYIICLTFGIIINLGIDKTIIPELRPSGEVRIHSPFFVVEPSKRFANNNFRLDCTVPSDFLINCSNTRFRWLKDGAYNSDFNDQSVGTVCDS